MIQYYTISDEARSVVVAESRSHSPNETGGILAGRLTEDCVQIEYAIQAGPQATHSPSRFQRDGDYSQKELNAIVRESNGEFDYVGEWHTHPRPSLLSSTDIRSMRWIISNGNYATMTPILLLYVRYVRCGKAKWQLHCYYFVKDSITRLQRAA